MRAARLARYASTTSNVPQVRGVPVLGTLPALLAAGGASQLHRYIDLRHRQLGHIFSEQLGSVSAVFISDPQMMRAIFAQEGHQPPMHALPEAWTLYNRLFGCARGLFFMNGREWQHYRRIMNHCLLRETGVKEMRSAIELVAGALEMSSDNLEVSLYRWSLDTIVAILLGAECYSKVMPDLRSLALQIQAVFATSAPLQFIPAHIAQKWRMRVWRNFERAVGGALDTTSDLVQDLLETPSCGGLLRQMRHANLSRADIIRIVVDLVLAAGDTTAYTMQWALYLLARHPEVQKACATEADMRDVLRETLRLYPVAPFITRINPDRPIHLGSFTIPPGTLVAFSLYSSGRDDSIFGNAAAFRPERWRPGVRSGQMMAASLPFAMGARSCVGRRIAELQISVTLEEVLRKYVVSMQEPDEDVDMMLQMVSVPAKPIRLRFVRKSNSARSSASSASN